MITSAYICSTFFYLICDQFLSLFYWCCGSIWLLNAALLYTGSADWAIPSTAPSRGV